MRRWFSMRCQGASEDTKVEYAQCDAEVEGFFSAEACESFGMELAEAFGMKLVRIPVFVSPTERTPSRCSIELVKRRW